MSADSMSAADERLHNLEHWRAGRTPASLPATFETSPTETYVGHAESPKEQTGPTDDACVTTDGCTVGFNETHTSPRLTRQPSNTYSNGPLPRPDPKPPYMFNSIKLQKHSFFRVGRVFRFPWSETAGTTSFSKTYRKDEFVQGRNNGTQIYQKNRDFVVIRAGHESCSVLPITTYGNQGVAKRSVDKSQHGVVYTGTEAPAISYQESLRPGSLQVHAIRVIGDQPTSTLDVMSRLNYGQVHTVHYNVEVESIGMVHPGSIPQLLLQFINVWVSTLILGNPHSQVIHELQLSPTPAGSMVTSPLEDHIPASTVRIPQENHQLPTSTLSLDTISHGAMSSSAASTDHAVGEAPPRLNPQLLNSGTINGPRRSFHYRRRRGARYSGPYHGDERHDNHHYFTPRYGG